MKKNILLLISIMFLSNIVFSQTWSGGSSDLNSNKQAAIKWDTMVIDLGKVKKGSKKDAIFNLTYSGGAPLIILSAEGTCGCTEINYPKRPIRQNETVKIKAVFDAETTGAFNKTVTINLSGIKSQKLHVKGVVIE